MAKNEPQIYRKGSARRTVLRILLWVLAVFLLFCVLAFFGFRKYIAYTDTGKLYLDIPWLEGYVSGPPENDDLAEYLAPVQRQPADTPEVSNQQTAPDSTAPDAAAPDDAAPDDAAPDSAAPDDTSAPQAGDTSPDNPPDTPAANTQAGADTSSDSEDTAVDSENSQYGESAA